MADPEAAMEVRRGQSIATRHFGSGSPVMKYPLDLGNSKWETQQFGYIQARQEAFESIGNQLDQLFWDIDNNKLDKTGEWYKAIKKIKDDNPKPE